MPSVQSVWNTVVNDAQSAWFAVQTAWYSLSPQHMRLIVGVAAVGVFLFLVSWAMSGRRGPATLSLNQSSWNDTSRSATSRRRASFNQSPLEGLSLNEPRPGAITPGWANVTPINRAPTPHCTHCDAPLSGSSSFCPACGFAQPAMQTGTAIRN
jgi:hypothetical protein